MTLPAPTPPAPRAPDLRRHASAPATGAAVGAGAGARLASYLVDLAVVGACAALAWGARPSAGLAVLVAAEAVAVLTVGRAATGRTPGALATRTVAVAQGTDHAPGLGRQSLRTLILVALHATVVGPALSILAGRQGRDWIDRLAGTATLARRPMAPPAPAEVAAADAYGRLQAPAPLGTRWEGPAPAHDATRDHAPAVAPAPAPPMPAPAVPAPAVPMSVPTAPTAVSPTPAPVVAPVGAPPAASTDWLVLDSGEREPLEPGAVLVLGRAPRPEDGERALVVADPTRSLSRTHARVGRDAQGLWVADAYSANGTRLRLPGTEPETMERGARRHVPSGTVLEIGERTMTVLSDPTS